MRISPFRVLVTLLCLASCSQGTDPGECQTACRPLNIYLEIERRTDIYPDSTTYVEIASASFLYSVKYSQIGVDAGEVRLNGTKLVQRGRLFDQGVEYESISPPLEVQVAPPLKQNIWNVPGSADAFAIHDSIQSPLYPLEMISPSGHTQLSMQSGFTVRWNRLDATDMKDLQLTVSNYTLDENGQSKGNRASIFLWFELPQDSLKILPDDLLKEGFRPGPLRIRLERRYGARHFSAGNRLYNLSFTDVAELHTTLDP